MIMNSCYFFYALGEVVFIYGGQVGEMSVGATNVQVGYKGMEILSFGWGGSKMDEKMVFLLLIEISIDKHSNILGMKVE